MMVINVDYGRSFRGEGESSDRRGELVVDSLHDFWIHKEFDIAHPDEKIYYAVHLKPHFTSLRPEYEISGEEYERLKTLKYNVKAPDYPNGPNKLDY